MTSERKHVRELQREFLEGIGIPEPAPFRPDAFQLEAIQSLADGNDTLVVAPTGSGKTYIAVEAIRATVEQQRRAVYTAPLKALSNAKYAEFRKRFEPTHSVGLLTGDRKIEGNADVIVATTEIYRNELYAFSENYSLVVLDEVHYLADPQRGPVWEESIILAPRSATLLMLSASISNPEETAEWIHEVRKKPVKIITMSERPVELRLGFLHPDLGVVPLADRRGELLPEVGRYYSGDFRDDRGPGRGRYQRSSRRRFRK